MKDILFKALPLLCAPLLALGLVTMSSAVCSAGTIAFSFSSSSPASAINSGSVLGFQFTPSVDILIDSLGYIDVGQDGLSGTHQVGIWNAGGTLIENTTLGTGTLAGPVLSGSRFTYTAITPITLSAGVTYTIGAEQDSADSIFFDPSGSQTSNIPSLLSVSCCGYFNVSGTFAEPVLTIGNHYDIVNFTASAAVPEPSSIMLTGSGIAGILACAFRRRKTVLRLASGL